MKTVNMSGMILLIVSGSVLGEERAPVVNYPLLFSEVRQILSKTSAESVFPGLASMDKSAIKQDPRFQPLWKSAARPPQPIPQTMHTLYREFRTMGDREEDQQSYYEKRSQLRDSVWVYGMRADASSCGHCTLRAGGMGQSAGREHRKDMNKIAENQFEIDMTRPYDIPTLTSLRRSLSLLEPGVILIEVHFVFFSSSEPIEGAFLTRLDASLEGNCALIVFGERYLEIFPVESDGTLDLTSIKDACREKNKPELLKWVTFALPTARENVARFVIWFHPQPVTGETPASGT